MTAGSSNEISKAELAVISELLRAQVQQSAESVFAFIGFALHSAHPQPFALSIL